LIDWFQMLEGNDHSALTQLRAYLAQNDYPADGRLPPERRLCEELGVTRTSLRKALATLELEGQIWRHVGRGTFIGARPLDADSGVGSIASQTNPAEVMEARLAFEPQLSRLAALHATPADIEVLALCIRKSKGARDWRVYETWDNKLHRAIAQATHNSILLSIFDTLNTVRRAVAWGRLRVYRLTPDLNHHSFGEHDAIFEAIAHRDMDLAEKGMRRHLESVRRKLLNSSVEGA
jgi:DNA-binding FadR family transcriptional regulator